MQRVDRVERVDDHVVERCAVLGVVSVLVQRLASAGRRAAPATLGVEHGDGVVLAGRPLHELVGGFLVLGAGLERERPRPQPAAGVLDLRRRIGDAQLVGEVRVLGRVEDQVGRGGRVVPHRDLALDEQGLALGEAGGDRRRLAVLGHGVDVELDRGGGLRGRDLGVPVRVVPAATEGVDDGAERSTHLAPAGKAAEADAVLAVGRIVERRGGSHDLIPRGLLGQRDALGLEQVLAIEQRRALAVERGRIELAVVGEAVADRLEEVGAVVGGVGVEGRADLVDPAELGPQRDLVHAHGHDVERAGAGGDVRRHLRADLVLGQDQQVDLDVRVERVELREHVLERGHLGVAHHADRDGALHRILGEAGGRHDDDRAERERRKADDPRLLGNHHGAPHTLPMHVSIGVCWRPGRGARAVRDRVERRSPGPAVCAHLGAGSPGCAGPDRQGMHPSLTAGRRT